jgi:hypothetical protein
VKKKRASKSRPRRVRPWSAAELRILAARIRSRVPARLIAKELGRTESAVRQRAAAEGISFRKAGRRRR